MTNDELREVVLDLISVAPDRYTPDVFGGFNFDLAVVDALALERAVEERAKRVTNEVAGYTPTGIA